MQDSASISVLIVNENPLMGRLMAAVIDNADGVQVFGTTDDLDTAFNLADEKNINIILISLHLPDQGALRLIKKINEVFPSMKIIVYGVRETEKQVLPLIEAGADGYIRKNDSVQEMLVSIRMAAEGKALVSPSVTAALLDRISELSSQAGTVNPAMAEDAGLTPREKEVLGCIGEGMTNSEIAEELVIEVGTVKNHVHSILDKLNVQSRKQASEYLVFINN